MIFVKKFAVVVLLSVLSSCGVNSQSNLTQAVDTSKITIADFRSIDGSVFRGARPSREQVEQLAAMGVRTIVSLETYIEPFSMDREESAAKEYGIQFMRVPLSPLPIYAPSVEDVKKAAALLADPKNQPAYVHCYSGRDRTGIVAAAYRILSNGWTATKAIEELQSIGHTSFLFNHWDQLLYDIH